MKERKEKVATTYRFFLVENKRRVFLFLFFYSLHRLHFFVVVLILTVFFLLKLVQLVRSSVLLVVTDLHFFLSFFSLFVVPSLLGQGQEDHGELLLGDLAIAVEVAPLHNGVLEVGQVRRVIVLKKSG